MKTFALLIIISDPGYNPTGITSSTIEYYTDLSMCEDVGRYTKEALDIELPGFRIVTKCVMKEK